jgi:hypothetical protein
MGCLLSYPLLWCPTVKQQYVHLAMLLRQKSPALDVQDLEEVTTYAAASA